MTQSSRRAAASEGSSRPDLLRVCWMAFGLFVAAAGMTLLFLAMRSVMAIGGYCAEGGPYVIAQQCPEGVVWVLPLGIVGGLIGFGIYIWANNGLPGPHLTLLAWPVLFLSLGWNFWEYGLNPPGGGSLVWGWIICGVVFVAMGAFPLFVLATKDARRAVFWADAGDLVKGRASKASSGSGSSTPVVPKGPVAVRIVAGSADDGADDLIAALDRITALHAQGSLTDDEFSQAKRKILGED